MRWKRTIMGGVLAIVCSASNARLFAQCETLTGQVAAGRSYQQSFGNGLLFRLGPAVKAPPNPEGWTIEVRDGVDGENDFVWVATPPYRFSNPRYLDTSYGNDARDVIAWDVRSFAFVTGEEEYRALAEAVRFLVSSRPPDMTEAEYEAAYDSIYPRWEALIQDAGKGELRIIDADVSRPTPERPRGRIERLFFTVTLCPGGGEPGGAIPRP